ncbi:WbqC family protein [Arhodomonas sp. AD133]|uniref:WbqC family protein n=1 Tax=Arhodomonas sp. AD133 TaxID=3415009 RepID=UPI003EBD8CD1
MTTVAIMQPYLFPYVGYYQLAAKSDIFVFLDDVPFIKRGYIHRNWLVGAGQQPVHFSIPVEKMSQNRNINDHCYVFDGGKLRRKIVHLYGNSSQYKKISPLVDQVVHTAGSRVVASVNAESITRTAHIMGLKTIFLTASEIAPKRNCRGQDRILALCRELGASHYINLPGGKTLYEPHIFREQGVRLQFLESFVEPLITPDGRPWHPSFLHYLFTTSAEGIQQLLCKAKLTDS